jgi:hypothetical protein
MTPGEWDASQDPQRMLEFLRDTGRVGGRQLRLFAAACCRQLWPLLSDERSRAGVEAAEQCAEDSAKVPAAATAYKAAWSAADEAMVPDDLRAAAEAWLDTAAGPGDPARWRAVLVAEHAARAAWLAARAARANRDWPTEDPAKLQPVGGPFDAWSCSCRAAGLASSAVTVSCGDLGAAVLAGLLLGRREEAFRAACRPAEAVQACLLRCVVGSPFRSPAPLAAVLAYNGGAARRLAQSIYDGRRFEDLPVLADLLEEAGLTDAALLGHLRGPGPHVLGCWALDPILGKR